MDLDNPPTQAQEDPEKMDTDEKEEPVEDGETKEKKPKKKAKKEEEPQSQVVPNLSRIVPGQLKYISFPEGTRFAPVKKVAFPCEG